MWNCHAQLEKSDSYKCAWCVLPSKDPTKFKRIKGFSLPPDYVSESGKFKGAPEIKKEIDAVENVYLLKLRKIGWINIHLRQKGTRMWDGKLGMVCILRISLHMHPIHL